jgi:hypothetical protein
MKRFVILAVAALVAVPAAVAAVGAASGGPRPPRLEGPEARLDRGLAYFAIACGFSHRNQDDPIVFPRRRGRSHDHTYFGNTSTDASSTPESLRAAGRTTCRLGADTAAYWAPTLFLGGRPVEPRGAVAYYIRRTIERVQPFPAGLEIIAGSAAARSPQSQRITFWSCGGRRGLAASSSIPTCASTHRGSLRLHVNFPNCWDGRRLDSADHQSHMAYSENGVCPAGHPVEVPALSLVIYYGVSGGGDAELSSGGQFSAHADFVNAWNQRTLDALVDRYLNGLRIHRGRR